MLEVVRLLLLAAAARMASETLAVFCSMEKQNCYKYSSDTLGVKYHSLSSCDSIGNELRYQLMIRTIATYFIRVVPYKHVHIANHASAIVYWVYTTKRNYWYSIKALIVRFRF